MWSEFFFSFVYTDEVVTKKVQDLNLCYFSFKLNALQICQPPISIKMLTPYVTACLTLTAILFAAGKTLPQIKMDMKKSSPYECGFDPISSARLPFSFRFFMVAILFLVFDLEIALLVATPFFIAAQKAPEAKTFILLFLLILIVGLWYEWEKDGLEWVYLKW